MKSHQLKCGAVVFVDDADYEAIAQFDWHLSDKGYVIRRVRTLGGPKKTIRMHCVIFGQTDLDVDHADGNKLNNCRSNLREATRTLNNANSKPRKGCSSQFKGVAWHCRYRKWWAYINCAGKRMCLGYHDDEIAAARAYNTAAPQIFGEFARLNPV